MDSTGHEALINRMMRGDDAAGAEVFERMREPLARFFLRLCGCRETAEDLVQGTFLRLLRRRAAGGADVESASYVYRVALNEWRTTSRRAARRPTAALPGDPVAPAPRAPAGARERCRRVLDAIERLPREQREVLILHRFEGLSCREIAEVAGCPPKTAESRLRLALRKVLDHLDGWEDDDGRP